MKVIKPSIDGVKLVPAFGRQYVTAQEVLVGFTARHPFRITGPHFHKWHNKCVSIRDLALNESVFLMYHHNEKIALFTLMDKG